MKWVLLIIIAILAYELLEEKMDKSWECRKCGNMGIHYCEKCYQDLVAENSRLQLEIKQKEENEERSKNEKVNRENKKIFNVQENREKC